MNRDPLYLSLYSQCIVDSLGTSDLGFYTGEMSSLGWLEEPSN